MAWRSGSFSRTLLNSARSASFRSSTNATPRLRPSQIAGGNLRPSRRLQFTNSRTLGEIRCVSSLSPLHMASARLTSYISVDARACCELSQGTFCRTCQDR